MGSEFVAFGAVIVYDPDANPVSVVLAVMVFLYPTGPAIVTLSATPCGAVTVTARLPACGADVLELEQPTTSARRTIFLVTLAETRPQAFTVTARRHRWSRSSSAVP